ncbi:MAG: flagellar motor switch protein FliM [Armatimonadota bacterium]
MLEQNEINNLLNTLLASQANNPASGDPKALEVKVYDFAQPENIPSDFLHALESINHQFGRSLAGMLTGLLSTGVQVEALSVEQMTYRQFCHQVPDVTVLGVFSLTPLDGTALLEINPHLVWYVIDRCLGGTGEIVTTPREISLMEKGLLEELFRRILRDMSKAWEVLMPAQMVLRDLGTNPVTMRCAQPDDRMVVSSFSITVQDVNALCTCTIPISHLDFERLLNMEHQWNEDERQRATREQQTLNEAVAMIPVSVRACLRDIGVPIGELASLRVGDVIYLNAAATDPVEVRIANLRSLKGRPLNLGTTLAIEVLDVESEDCNDHA